LKTIKGANDHSLLKDLFSKNIISKIFFNMKQAILIAFKTSSVGAMKSVD